MNRTSQSPLLNKANNIHQHQSKNNNKYFSPFSSTVIKKSFFPVSQLSKSGNPQI